jgi:hypothetical protein
MVEQPEVVHEHESQTMSVWRNVVIVVLRATPGREQVDALGREVERIGRTGKKVGLVHLVHIKGAIGPPEEQARRRYIELIYDQNTMVACSSVVIEREGFGAAVIRSIIAGLALITRAKFPTRVFATIADATAWVADQLAAAGDPVGEPAELTGVVQAADGLAAPRSEA